MTVFAQWNEESREFWKICPCCGNKHRCDPEPYRDIIGLKTISIDHSIGETASDFMARVDAESKAQVAASEAKLSWWFKFCRRWF